MTGTNRLIQNHSHWGAFLAEVEDGRVVGVRPFARDSDPSPLLQAMPAAVHSPMRIAQPMVREGWLANGPGASEGRGRERFVPVSWERALDLVAGELARVRDTYGHSAIMGGSQGWGSAGIFHDARTNVRRFLAAFGGFVDQASNYSFGAALTFLPHILGSAQAVSGPLTSWSSIARHGRLVVLFGGANPKNTQVMKGGCGVHTVGGWMQELGRVGVEVVNVSPIREDGPEAAAATWIPIRPNTDTAMLLAMVHTLIVEGLHDQAFLASHCVGLRARAALRHGRERRPAEECGMGRGDLRRSRRYDPFTGAPHGGDAQHGQRVMVAAARRPRRAAVLGGDAAGVGARPNRLAGRRLRVRLWLGSRHCRAVAGVRTADAWRCWAIRSPAVDSGRRALPTVCCSPGESTITTARRAPILICGWSIGPAAIRSTIIRTPTSCAAPGGGLTPSSCTSRGGRRPRAMPTSCCRRPLRSSATTSGLRIATATSSPCSRRSSRSVRRVATTRSLPNSHVAWAATRAYTQGRDEMEWLRHLYNRWREKVRTNQAVASRISMSFWNDGFVELPLRADEYVMFGDFRADPQQHRWRRRQAGSSSIPSASRASAMTTVRRIRPGSNRPSGWARRHAKLPAASGVEPAALSAAQPDGSGTGQRARQGRRPRGGLDQSADAAARGIADGDVVRCTTHAAPASPARS